MALEFMDKISKYLPSIQGPKKPLSLREKMYWTAGILVIYFLLYNTYAIGVNQQDVTQPLLQLISIIFAAKVGSLITVGIGPIVLSSIILQLINGSGLIKLDLTETAQKSRFQALQKLSAICIAVIESVVFVLSGYVPVASPSLIGYVILQLAIGAIIIIFLDEIMSKWGITSGINMFIAAGVSYAIIAGTVSILIPEAAAAIAAGGAAAPANALLAFGPLIFAFVIFLVSIYAYEMKVELPLSFEQLRGVGGRLPIPFLYVSVLPVILASSLELSLTVWFRFLAGVKGNLASVAKFIAYYQSVGGTQTLSGGLVYLISPTFPLPYSAPYGIGGYGAYFTYLATHTSNLFLPWGGMVLVPEWVHVIVYTVVLLILCVIFGKFWIEMTGQSPKNMAQQLGETGWQIPGFRRDPRVIENVLNKYVPTITVLGSLFVGLLAAIATLTGAIGTGMGILLTVGIIYMLYQQLEQENLYDTYPILNKITK
ncbi:MAG: preprotein translocase subunit SecY [Candidatus Micrarchaeales archaeon]|jgi:preprotein translocase subunit SecY|uniref:SecY protein n=1 Tax=Candidatus Micrarchaeum acidiphilum ARMAN-2 TaxID=425595 RepID=C7DI14_MICA2|nr:MAG: SecY protein [Candidatus Micrarchaeum acidiphilum ARMAN-2]MCW6160836.1 preprotein translocase subunit SecY [Candidatus Micrarchaeales archaeon]